MPQTFLKLKGIESAYKALQLKEIQEAGMTPGSLCQPPATFPYFCDKKVGQQELCIHLDNQMYPKRYRFMSSHLETAAISDSSSKD